MSDLSRRNELGRKAERDSGWGECFIAVRKGDKVHTLSGMAQEVQMEREDLWGTTGPVLEDPLEYGRLQVSVLFRGDVVEELRPFDGGADK